MGERAGGEDSGQIIVTSENGTIFGWGRLSEPA